MNNMLKINLCLSILLDVISSLRMLYSFLLTDQRCVVCGEQAKDIICTNCVNKLFYEKLEHKLKEPNQYCRCCARPLSCETEVCIACKRELAERQKTCKEQDVKIRSVCLFPYVAKYIDLVLIWKMEDMRSLSALFAQLIARYISATPSLQGIRIVPVPPRLSKLKTKGWDQIEDICLFLEAKHGMKIERLLCRKDGHTQKGLNKEERKKNVEGMFSLQPKVKKALQKNQPKGKVFQIPSTVILLDDVITTGATLHACQEALKEAGCSEIINMTLFFH